MMGIFPLKVPWYEYQWYKEERKETVHGKILGLSEQGLQALYQSFHTSLLRDTKTCSYNCFTLHILQFYTTETQHTGKEESQWEKGTVLQEFISAVLVGFAQGNTKPGVLLTSSQGK